ncbi:4-oxalocrotonate tautomerase [Cohaesibacter marisflavi]|uniref:4-oxalocrotonate tautomerase n=1 Tax=Cohaesibacter marisflavi TaxID=655353 RepID=A0A1I4ZJD4_9HYPH|nr:tautomerase family protein [Cohaesibacter marisflavi]SFN50060.1 4-oxalocrotonate tautomerase [Cohaesibacter marisflavi]
MPHMTLKIAQTCSDEKKKAFVDQMTRTMKELFDVPEEQLSIDFLEFTPSDWVDRVYYYDVQPRAGALLKEPGYEIVSA